MATPHVAGAAALVLAACDLSTTALRQNLLANAEPVPGLAGLTITGARLDVAASLEACSTPQEPGFSLSATPPARAIAPGQTADYTLSVAPVGGFTGTVALAVTGLPAGVTSSFDPSSIAGGSGSATLSVVTTAGTVPGTYGLTVTATSGALTRTTTLTLDVLPPADFTLHRRGGLADDLPRRWHVVPGQGDARRELHPAGLVRGVGPAGRSQRRVLGTGHHRVAAAAPRHDHGRRVGRHLPADDHGDRRRPRPDDGRQPDDHRRRGAELRRRRDAVHADHRARWLDVVLRRLTRSGGFSSEVSFTVTGLPAGATPAFTPPATTGDSSTLAIATTAAVPGGTYPLTVTATGGGLTRTATATLVVSAPDFTLAATPPSQTVAPGEATTFGVTVTRVNGFADAVGFTVSGLPAGATGSFAPASTTGTATTLTIGTNTSVAAGTYVLTITGTAGAVTRTTTVTLVVGAASGGFTLAVTPSSRTIAPGRTTSYSLTITRDAGFTDGVSFTVSGLPSTGIVSASFLMQSPTASMAVLRIATDGSVPAGTYPLAITGTGGGVTRAVNVTLTITP